MDNLNKFLDKWINFLNKWINNLDKLENNIEINIKYFYLTINIIYV